MKKDINRTAPTIGVVAISRNEKMDLPAFFEHLLPWVDEIVIVDDGSTDGTKELIKKAGPKVRLIEQEMDKDSGFAGQRNRGIQESGADWLLHMDIDERVPPALATEIISAIQNDRFYAYRYRRLNFFLHRPMKAGGFQDWNNPQLARRGKHYFENAVHENCVVQDAPGSIGQLKEKMWHLNDESYRERMEKSLVYCQEQARRLAKRGIRMRWYHLVLLPIAEFLRKMVKKRGYRDGTTGLLFALHSCCAMFRACALVWDDQNPVSRMAIEERLQALWKVRGEEALGRKEL
jgi:(heptosyl)LPS beta-1,4-glucosyltransferase